MSAAKAVALARRSVEVQGILGQVLVGDQVLVVDEGDAFLGLGQAPDHVPPGHAGHSGRLVVGGEVGLVDAVLGQVNDVAGQGVGADDVVGPEDDIGALLGGNGDLEGVVQVRDLGELRS